MNRDYDLVYAEFAMMDAEMESIHDEYLANWRVMVNTDPSESSIKECVDLMFNSDAVESTRSAVKTLYATAIHNRGCGKLLAVVEIECQKKVLGEAVKKARSVLARVRQGGVVSEKEQYKAKALILYGHCRSIDIDCNYCYRRLSEECGSYCGGYDEESFEKKWERYKDSESRIKVFKDRLDKAYTIYMEDSNPVCRFESFVAKLSKELANIQ